MCRRRLSVAGDTKLTADLAGGGTGSASSYPAPVFETWDSTESEEEAEEEEEEDDGDAVAEATGKDSVDVMDDAGGREEAVENGWDSAPEDRGDDAVAATAEQDAPDVMAVDSKDVAVVDTWDSEDDDEMINSNSRERCSFQRASSSPTIVSSARHDMAFVLRA